MSLAWHTAALSMADPKKFPKLDTLMSDHKPAAKVKQTPAEMLTAMRAWAGAVHH